jgi:predicted permease
MSGLLQDLRYAARILAKAPVFTGVAVLTLALGIGATTAVFSVLNAAVLTPLPVTNPHQLVIISPQRQGERYILFNPVFESIRQRQRTLSDMFAVNHQPYLRVLMDGDQAPTYVRASLVSGSYFSALGLVPTQGRLLVQGDDEVGGDCVAVISDSFWKRRFGAEPDTVGRVLRVRERNCTIVGMAPSEFVGHQKGYVTDVWLPLRPLTDSNLLASHSMAFFDVMGRLKPGVSNDQAEAELTALYQQIQANEPSQLRQGRRTYRATDFGIGLISGATGLERRELRELLTLVLGCVGVVLLIGAINVANLQIARGAARHRELTTRAALGAGRLRLLRQVATEGVVIAGLGGALAIMLAWLGTPALARFLSPGDLAIGLDMSPDHRVVLVAFGAITLAAILGGVLPALRLSRVNLQVNTMQTRTITGPGQRLTRTLVAAQFALALSLLTATGLLLRTVVGLSEIDPGFRPDNVVVLQTRDERPGSSFGIPDTADQQRERAARYDSLEERLNGLPGVGAASLSWLGLFSGSDAWENFVNPDEPTDRRGARVDYVSARYFETVGMQILRGRNFTQNDREGSPRIAVVNEALIRQRFGTGDALGRRLILDSPREQDRPYTVVGIVRDSKYNDLRENAALPMIWIPLLQAPFRISAVSLLVQPGTEGAVAREAERTMTSVDPYLMVRQVTTLSAQLNRRTARERRLFGAAWTFGGLALLLAAIGLYATLTYGVTQRTREMGVRLALGAQPQTLLRMVVGEAVRVALAGLVLGVPLALLIAQALREFLFGVDAQDLPTLMGACLVLIVTTMFAAYIPARWASRVDPLVALRYE